MSSLRSPQDARPLLEIRNLRTYFYLSGRRVVRAVDGVELTIAPGKVLGLVGESGSGKSMIARSILRLLDPRARIEQGEILYKGRNLLELSDDEIQKVRGRQISMVFQDPVAALNPVLTIGRQIKNALRAHRLLGRREAEDEASRLLQQVRLKEPRRLLDQYPHELSGGMQQRVVVAMALASGADLIIADEPTTALDVTTQLEILALFDELRRTYQLSMLFITHNFGVVAYICDDVCVMRRGKIVERGTVEEVLERPSHPYTRSLLNAIPNPDRTTTQSGYGAP